MTTEIPAPPSVPEQAHQTIAVTNNFPVRPDHNGDLMQQYAAKILALDQHAVVPRDMRACRALIAELEARCNGHRASAATLRNAEYHRLYNEALPRMSKARRLGVRPRAEKLPPPPSDGNIGPDDLQAFIDLVNQLDADIETFEAQTPEQRRIASLERRIAKIVDHSNTLVRCLNELEDRVAKLEAEQHR